MGVVSLMTESTKIAEVIHWTDWYQQNRKPASDEQKRRMKEMLRNGYTHAEAAEKLGLKYDEFGRLHQKPPKVVEASQEKVFAAVDDGYYFFPKEAMGPTVKSAPGNHHEEITGDPLPEHRVGAVAPAPPVPPDYDSSSWEPRDMPRQPMQDDAGAATGLRRRPDYDASSKGASAQYVVALDAHSRKEASETATMYVTGIDWDGLKVASFTFGNISKALRLPNLTAKAVSKQLIGPKFGVKARPIVSTT